MNFLIEFENNSFFFFSLLEYLSSVLDDFGLKDVADFQDMIELLKIDADKFDELAENKPTRMVIISTIRTMRKL